MLQALPDSCVLLALLFIAGSAGAARAVLVSHYTFDEGSGQNVVDHVGSHDAIKDSGTIGWISGILGGAGDFDGSTDLKITGLLAGATEFTLAAWFNSDTNDGGYKGIFAARENSRIGDNATNWGLNTESDGNGSRRFDVRFDNPSGTASVGFDTANNSAPVGAWAHIAQTWRNDGTGEVYLNGTQVGPYSGASMVFSDSGTVTWYLGSDVGRSVDGQIDDLGVWNEALPATEIARIYHNATLGFNLSTPGTIIAGDVTGEGLVNTADFEVIRTNFFKNLQGRDQGDLVDDGVIDFRDFAQWKRVTPKDPDSFGALQSVAVPEPSMIRVIALGGIAWLCVRGGYSASRIGSSWIQI